MTENEEELPWFGDDQVDRPAQIRAAELGIEAQGFLESRIGQHIVNKAEHEKALFLEQLIDCDPDDTKENRRIRNEIKLREFGLNWLLETIGSGKVAENDIHGDPQPLPDV